MKQVVTSLFGPTWAHVKTRVLEHCFFLRGTQLTWSIWRREPTALLVVPELKGLTEIILESSAPLVKHRFNIDGGWLDVSLLISWAHDHKIPLRLQKVADFSSTREGPPITL